MAWLSVFLLLGVVCPARQAVDPVSPPSKPKCKIPFSAGTDIEIQCSWDPGLYPALYYTLHWESDFQGKPRQINVSDTSAVIPRDQFSKHWDMCVWVTAWKPPTSKKSNSTCFNTESIEQQDAPKVTVEQRKPLEISWKFHCESYDDAHCIIQYRMKDESNWVEELENSHSVFILEDAFPFSVYEFRVTCACKTGDEVPLSDWSSICEVQTPEAEPVGVLDVWSHCRHSSEHSDCVLLWKELPRHLARGNVIGYLMKLEHNVTENLTNVSSGDVKWREDGHDRCCRLLVSLKEVTGVHLSAYTLQGATEPAHLALLADSDHLQYGQLLVAVGRDGRSLNVSWDTYNPKESVQEYVVQYKDLEHNSTMGINWIKVKNTEKSVIFPGNFRNYIPYNVSLFQVSGNRSHLLRSAIIYTVQDIPPEVKGFQVSEISSTEVTLTWQHIPLIQRRGIILNYAVGIGNHTEYHVPEDRNSFSISNLQPNEHYSVWICAETVAGRGPRTPTTFIAPVLDPINKIIMVMSIPAILLCLALGLLTSFCCKRLVSRSMVPSWCCDKVPDPTNSRVFKPDQHCFNTWSELSPPEANHKMCLVEVIEYETSGDESCLEKSQMCNECTKGQICGLSDQDLQEDLTLEEQQEEDKNVKDHNSSCSSLREPNMELNNGVEDYSTVRDTDNWTRENRNTTETWQFSDYEKHFMPSPYEV